MINFPIIKNVKLRASCITNHLIQITFEKNGKVKYEEPLDLIQFLMHIRLNME